MKHNKEKLLLFPERYTRKHLNELYRDIPMKATTSRTLRKYFNAMANLYGIVTLKKAFEIISSQNPELVSEDEFLAFAEIARHEDGDYYIFGVDELFIDGKIKSPFEREIIDIMLVDEDFDLYYETHRGQQGKPFYVPDKKRFLLYNDPYYYEETSAATALKEFLKKRFELTDKKVSGLFEDIQFNAKYYSDGFSKVMEWFEYVGLVFEKDADLEKFLGLYQQFQNNTRMPYNRGYTPDETLNMYPPEQRIPRSISLGPNIRKAVADGSIDLRELYESILTADMPSEELRFNFLREIAGLKEAPKKVGRNDPCPCGSGKKYKNCCGR